MPISTKKRTVTTAEDVIPAGANLAALRRAAAGCKACDLWKNATQTVFGEGKAGARVMMVGEQPGDQEDLAGKPFVGPAGRLLDEALLEAGIEREEVYITNIVKHFRWVVASRGKRRIHKKPSAAQIAACVPWLHAEIARVRPQILVCLGATAAESLLGKGFSVTREHGKLVESALAPQVVATVHPSSVLRAPDEEARIRAKQSFIHDLKKIALLLQKKA
jgi:uracil-DNA glycosylase family protein